MVSLHALRFKDPLPAGRGRRGTTSSCLAARENVRHATACAQTCAGARARARSCVQASHARARGAGNGQNCNSTSPGYSNEGWKFFLFNLTSDRAEKVDLWSEQLGDHKTEPAGCKEQQTVIGSSLSCSCSRHQQAGSSARGRHMARWAGVSMLHGASHTR